MIGWGWYLLTDKEWAAFATVAALGGMAVSFLAMIATAAAVYAAIRIPRDVANEARDEARNVEKQRRDEASKLAQEMEDARERELTMRYHEVASATYNGLDVVSDAIKAFQQPSSLAFLQCAARAVALSEALRILIRAPRLTDGPIVSGAAAASSLDAVARAGDVARRVVGRIDGEGQERHREIIVSSIPGIREELQSALILAKEAQTRIDKVRDRRKIEVRKDRDFPVLPTSV